MRQTTSYLTAVAVLLGLGASSIQSAEPAVQGGDALQSLDGSAYAAAVPVWRAAAGACTAPPEWPDGAGQIGEWRFRHLCLDNLESFDVAALDAGSQLVSLTFSCWDGQMSGVVHLSPAATDLPEGRVEISATGVGPELHTSSELQDVYGDRSMEIDDDAFFRGLASAMAEADGEAFPITLHAVNAEPLELTFPLDGFREAVAPLRSRCLW